MCDTLSTTSSKDLTAKHEQHELADLEQQHNFDSLDSKEEEGGSAYKYYNDRRRGFRAKWARILNSHIFHIVVLVLVGIDCFLVFGELIIDLKLFQNQDTCINNSSQSRVESEENHTLEIVEKTFHYMSIGLLALFVLEVILKLAVFGYSFFFKLEELVDATIIIVSFVLDIIFIHNGLLKFMGALIFLRMWRIVRIVHAIITAVMTPMEHKIEIEAKRRIEAESELKEAQQEIETLKRRLLSNEDLRNV